MISFKEFLDNLYDRYVVGEKIYKSLKNIINDKPGTGSIVAGGHMGDTVWLCMYAEAFKKKHGYDKVIYVFREDQDKLAELYPSIDEIITIKSAEMALLNFYICINKLYDLNNIYYGYYHVDNYIMTFPNLTASIDRYIGVQLSTHTERMIGLKEGSERNLMKIPFIPELNEWKSTFINSVMLIPSAISVQNVPLDFWVKLTVSLQELGYEVYTNYNNLEYEMVIPGTSSIGTDLAELAALGQCFSAFIGLRSGACDLLAQADAKLFVLYKDESDKLYYDMKDHRKDTVHDYVWSKEREQQIIDDILENIV